jgi:hypothetical protein
VIPLAAPKVRDNNPQIGMAGHDSCRMIPGEPRAEKPRIHRVHDGQPPGGGR